MDGEGGCNLTVYNKTHHLVAISSLAGASAALCLASILLIFALRLISHSTYRLSVYLDAVALAHALCSGFQLLVSDYGKADGDAVVCQTLGSLVQYLLLAKLFFSFGLSVHVFNLAVLHKTLARLEPACLIAALVFPAILAAIPFATGSYGWTESQCWIRSWLESGCPRTVAIEGVVEQFALWYGPALVILSAEAVLMMVAMGIAVVRTLKTDSDQLVVIGDRHRTWIFIHMLPLMIYPIASFLLLTAACVANATSLPFPGYVVMSVASFCVSAWDLITGLAVLSQILAVIVYRKAFAAISARHLARMQDEYGATTGEDGLYTSSASRATESVNWNTSFQFSPVRTPWTPRSDQTQLYMKKQ